jgi:putative transposase
MQDRDGAKPVLLDTYLGTPVRSVFADGAFAGRLLDWARTILATTLHIVRKPADQRGFAVIPRRWAVERILCAARRSVVSPVQPGGIWREAPGSNC